MNEIITIVAVTYRHGRLLRAFCDNMLNQHGVEGRWKCIILHDGSIKANDPDAVESAYESGHIVDDVRVSERFGITRRVGEQPPPDKPTAFHYYESLQRESCYGHNLRAIGLEKVETPYVHFTNADNQYSYGWLERVIPVLERQAPDMVLWNCSHSYSEFHSFRPELQAGKIDFCNYALRTELAKEVGFPWRHREADGAQIEAIRDGYPNLKVARMENVFAIHN